MSSTEKAEPLTEEWRALPHQMAVKMAVRPFSKWAGQTAKKSSGGGLVRDARNRLQFRILQGGISPDLAKNIMGVSK